MIIFPLWKIGRFWTTCIIVMKNGYFSHFYFYCLVLFQAIFFLPQFVKTVVICKNHVPLG